MQITNEMLAKFIGGQAEIQNQKEGYIYRGEVKNVSVKNNELQVEFAWLAKGEGFPPLPTGWVKDDCRDYAVSLEIYHLTDVSDDRLCFNSSFVGETIVLFSPNSNSKLDPAKVKSLA